MVRRKELMSVRRIADELAEGTLLDQKMEVEFDGKDMIISREMAELFNADSAGRLRPGGDVADASVVAALVGVATSAQQNAIMNAARLGPTFGVMTDASTANARRYALPQIMFVPVTTDGAGLSAQTELVAALAGYQSCCRIDYIFALGTDGAWDLDIASTTGLSGPSAFVGLASTANEIGPDWERGLYFQNTAGLESIHATISNGGNVITYYIAGVYWYET